jgi:hypothetical protein
MGKFVLDVDGKMTGSFEVFNYDEIILNGSLSCRTFFNHYDLIVTGCLESATLDNNASMMFDSGSIFRVDDLNDSAEINFLSVVMSKNITNSGKLRNILSYKM